MYSNECAAHPAHSAAHPSAPRSLPRIDSSPDDGTVCKDPVTHKYPKSQKVCGLCGILSDSSYPTGAFVV